MIPISREDILRPIDEFEMAHNIRGTRDDMRESSYYRTVDMDVEKLRKRVYNKLIKFNF